MSLNLNLSHFFLLLSMGAIGSVAIMPYAMAIQDTVEFTPTLIFISVLQGIILSTIAIFTGTTLDSNPFLAQPGRTAF